jgi:hypothetical protein
MRVSILELTQGETQGEGRGDSVHLEFADVSERISSFLGFCRDGAAAKMVVIADSWPGRSAQTFSEVGM